MHRCALVPAQVLFDLGVSGDRDQTGLYHRCLLRMAADPDPDW